MRIAAIYNPISGGKSLECLQRELLEKFSQYEFELWETQCTFHAIDLAKTATMQGYDTVIAIGGDGTIIEVICGIRNTNTRLGIIPFGTGNMLASNLGIPLNPSKAIDVIIEGNSQKIDLGKINDRYFAFMAGCGFDAKIIGEVSREKKRKFGLLAYFAEGFRQAFKSKLANFKIILDDKRKLRTRATGVIIANSANIVGNFFSLAPQASLSDGLLDVIILSPRSFVEYLPVLWEMMRKQAPLKKSNLKLYQAKKIEITTNPILPVQADGDLIGTTPIIIEVIPNAIEVIIPKIPDNNHIYDLADDHLKRMINQTLSQGKGYFLSSDQ